MRYYYTKVAFSWRFWRIIVCQHKTTLLRVSERTELVFLLLMKEVFSDNSNQETDNL